MKKVLSLLGALMVLCGTAFAASYHGDVQVHTGLAFDKAKASPQNNSIECRSAAFELGVQSWHLFDLNKNLALGAMASLDFGFGGTTKYSNIDSSDLRGAFHCNFLMGPAVEYKLNNTVRFLGTFGFSWMISDQYWTEPYTDLDFGTIFNACGIGLDLQAKFFPTKNFSPVAGYRFTCNWSNKLTNTVSTKDEKQTTTKKVDNAYSKGNTFYIGAAYNF